MKTEKYKGHKVVYYDSVEELPINRFQAFNKWLMLDSGIGSDLNAVNTRLNNIAKYINLDSKEEALKEIANLTQAFAFITGHLSPEFNAFICLCDSIDGQKLSDLSDEGIKGYIELLSRKKIPILKLREWLNAAKKK